MLPTNILKVLYHTLVESYISYGLLVWGNSTHINTLVTLQKRALRIICNKPYRAHTDPLFRLHGILKLQDLYELQILLFMFDYKQARLPRSFENCFTLNSDNINRVTRRSGLFYTSKPRTNFSARLPTNIFLKTWNNYAKNIDHFNTRNGLKAYLKSHFLSTYQTDIKCNNPYCMSCR